MNRSRSTNFAKLLPGERRRSIRLAYLNGGLWGLGNGLAGTSLVIYLANTYGAKGAQLSWILAAPALVGVLRLLTPLWMDRVGNRQRFCARMFFASAMVLLSLPLLSAPGVLPGAAHSIPVLIVCWAGYHLLEHFAVVAMWSWFGDLAPRRIRGRFVGRRTGWMTAGRVLGVVAAAAVTVEWRRRCEDSGQMENLWMGYASLASVAAVTMMIAVGPLLQMVDPPSPSEVGGRGAKLRWQELLQPFFDAHYLRLLCYGWWFSLANGITATTLYFFQMNVLKLEFAEKRVLDASSRGMQALLMPWVGAQADRRGNVSVLVISQLLVAAALLFLLPASVEAKWWIIGTYALWVAYAGTNVANPNLMLHLSDPRCSAAYSAAWFASTQLVYALSTLAGGWLYDVASEHWTPRNLAEWRIDYFAALILLGWLLRSLGIFWALRIRENKTLP
ncbi:MAG: MFS transporter [Pirellulales bacterium]|nr:MFS transporter [Pirellulales bacterium]